MAALPARCPMVRPGSVVSFAFAELRARADSERAAVIAPPPVTRSATVPATALTAPIVPTPAKNLRRSIVISSRRSATHGKLARECDAEVERQVRHHVV